MQTIGVVSLNRSNQKNMLDLNFISKVYKALNKYEQAWIAKYIIFKSLDESCFSYGTPIRSILNI